MSMPVIVPSTTTREQAVNDLLESVALEETGLSHILNAEGEKLQKVIAMDDATTEDLLNTNQSVQNMVTAITQLETVLQAKLEIARDIAAGTPATAE